MRTLLAATHHFPSKRTILPASSIVKKNGVNVIMRFSNRVFPSMPNTVS